MLLELDDHFNGPNSKRNLKGKAIQLKKAKSKARSKKKYEGRKDYETIQ